MDSKISTIIFDLDDTLYEEMQFVKGGFKVVSEYLSKEFNVDRKSTYLLLLDILEKRGRGKIFDIALEKLEISNNKLVEKLVYIYRTHEPNISLHKDAVKTLDYFKKNNYKLGIITDGNVDVQKNKFQSLNFNVEFDAIIYSDEYGISNRKPSTSPYKKALNKIGCKGNEAVYIGDDPNKDFIGAKKLGILTIRILRGKYKDIRLSKDYEAEFKITNLEQIKRIIS